MSNKNNPRWLHEIPKPINTGKKRKLSEEEKEEAKKFEKAVNNGKIDEWIKNN